MLDDLKSHSSLIEQIPEKSHDVRYYKSVGYYKSVQPSGIRQFKVTFKFD